MYRLGLGGVLTFDSSGAERGMGRAQRAFQRLTQSSNRFIATTGRVGMAMMRMGASVRRGYQRLQMGMGMIGGGLRTLSMAMLPFAFAIGKGIKTAMGFEKQMAAVGSILRKNSEEMEGLTAKAAEMGITSVFTAKQSGEAMEFMARAGAKEHEIISGISGVMAMASADSMELAEAADIVAGTVKGMGYEWSEASHIADVLALTSSKTNTNIAQLGQSFSYGAAAARTLGLKIEQTSAIFGVLADASVRGSRAGTAYVNMMGKLAKPSDKAAALMGKWNIKLDDGAGKMRLMGDIVADFKKHLDKLPTPMARLGAAQELFGKRGARAFNALAVAGKKRFKEVHDAALAASEGIGVAQEMANRRLDNLSGAFTLLASSVGQASIEIFTPLMDPMAKTVQEATFGLNQVLFTVQALQRARESGMNIEEEATKLSKKHGATATQMALGVMDAIKSLKEGWKSLVETIKDAGRWIEEKFGKEGVRSLTKMIIKVATFAGLLVPIALGIGLITWAIKGGLIPIIKGLGIVLKVAMGPVGLIILLIVGLLYTIKRDHEDLFDTVSRVWTGIANVVSNVWENYIKPFAEGFWAAFKPVLSAVKEALQTIFGLFGWIFGNMVGETRRTTEQTKALWKDWGRAIGRFVGAVVAAVMAVISAIIDMIAALGKAYYYTKHFVRGMSGATIEDMRKVDKEMEGFLRSIGRGKKVAPEGVSVEASSKKWREQFGKKDVFKYYYHHPEVFAKEVTAPAAIKTYTDAMMKFYGTADEKIVGIIHASHERIRKRVAEQAVKMKAFKEGERAAAAKPTPGPTAAEIAKATGERKIDVKSVLCVDGKEVATAVSRHQVEIQERSGAKTTPYQRRTACEFAAIPTAT